MHVCVWAAIILKGVFRIINSLLLLKMGKYLCSHAIFSSPVRKEQFIATQMNSVRVVIAVLLNTSQASRVGVIMDRSARSEKRFG